MARASGFPRQIRFIVGNEACERFSYYGMRSILVVFMIHQLGMLEHAAKGVYHTFMTAAYFTPLLGGYLSDRFLGKYRTIIYLSIVYCLGHLVLALFETRTGLYAGLALIALGAGGIKPCVSAHVGDQFDNSNDYLIEKVFEVFYWSINFGSFFATLLIPWTLPRYGASVAFAIPGVLMALATLVFWMGRNYYVHVPPTGKEGGSRFWELIVYAIAHRKERKQGESWLQVATPKFGVERVEGARAVVDVFKVLIAVSAFWALFDQQGSSWVLQASQMDRNILGFQFEASQLHSLNPILVMVFIPIFSYGIYPLCERLGFKMTALRKMSVGMALTGFSFLAAGLIQSTLDRGNVLSAAWQFGPYFFITASEIMVSITGLEFAYTQAPRAMKSTIMSLWLLTIAVGNWFTAVVSYMNPFQGAMEFYFYAGMMFTVAVLFIVGAMRYKERRYIEDGIKAGVPSKKATSPTTVPALGIPARDPDTSPA